MKKFLCYLYVFFINGAGICAYEYNIAPNKQTDSIERPIVVCIPSYNNEKYCESCLDSVFAQNYKNFRVIYIDDASTDSTYDMVDKYIEKNNLFNRILLISNTENKKMLYNHYTMAHLCADEEIIFSLDGDDTLFSEDALSRVNRAYMDPNVWITYGQFQETGSTSVVKPKAFYKHKFHPLIVRSTPFLFMQPRTYYAGLFKKIPKDYFMDGDLFFQTAGDVAIMTFLIDLGRDHTYFIPEVIYSYNNENPINDSVNRKYQLAIENLIKKRPPLEGLKELY